MKKSFRSSGEPWVTAMIQTKTEEQAIEKIHRSIRDGANAIGYQTCVLEEEYRNAESYRRIFDAAGDCPVYVTNYRHMTNMGKSDEELAEGLIMLAENGATLCDVLGDCFAPCEGELTMDATAVGKQKQLIADLHQNGAEVLMSSHVLKFTPAEEVLRIALEHQSRGADISKIVTGADTVEQEIENLRITRLLKESLQIPFLFLSVGVCRMHRLIGPSLGCIMYLCTQEYDEFATKSQPLIGTVKAVKKVGFNEFLYVR